MKKLKQAFCLLTTAISILSLNITASAEDIANDINSNEVNQSEIAINEFMDAFSDIENDGVVYSIDGEEQMVKGLNLEGYDLSKAYKSYFIDGYMIDDYKKTKNFTSLISDKYHVYVPSNYNIITLYPNDDNVLEVIGTEEKNGDDDKIYLPEEAEKIKAQIDEEIVDIKYAKSFLYYLELIYIQTTENEYVVPYFTGMIVDDISGRIDNGRLYTPDEFIQAMDNTFDYENTDPDSSGGVNLKPVDNKLKNKALMNPVNNSAFINTDNAENNNSNNMVIVYSISIGVALAAIFIGSFIYKKIKKKHTQN